MRLVGASHVMLAGGLTESRSLIGHCRNAIAGFTSSGDEINVTEMMTGLREAVVLAKRQAASIYMAATYGLSFEQFFNHATKNFSEAHAVQIWAEIGRVDLGAALIVTTFSQGEAAIGEAVLISISPIGRVSWDNHYAAIGSGALVSSSFLGQREYDDSMGLAECMYRVIEAKMAAERTPYVGKKSRVEIVRANGREVVDDSVIEEIRGQVLLARRVPTLTLDRSRIRPVT